MAIVRTKIIRLGVSYGSGCIKFGNDELAYCDALRAFPRDGTYAAFKEAYDAIDVEALEAAAAARAEAEAGDEEPREETATGADVRGEESETADEDAPAEDDKPEDEAPEKPGAVEEDAPEDGAPRLIPFEIAPDDEEDGEQEAPEEPERDPTVTAAIEAADAFKETCSDLAFSEMYEQMAAIVASLEENVLPPVAALQKLDSDYRAIVDYVSHH